MPTEGGATHQIVRRLARISHTIFARSSRFVRRFANVFRGVLAGGVRKTRAELGFSWLRLTFGHQRVTRSLKLFCGRLGSSHGAT